MPKYLLDAHLPYKFSLFSNPDYLHLKDINPAMDDEQIWEYAQQNNLTIITKDCDFSERILLLNPPPKVIHLRIGNMRLRQLYVFLSEVWPEVLKLSTNNKLVNVYKDRIEGID